MPPILISSHVNQFYGEVSIGAQSVSKVTGIVLLKIGDELKIDTVLGHASHTRARAHTYTHTHTSDLTFKPNRKTRNLQK